MSATAYSWLVGPRAESPEAYVDRDGALRSVNDGKIVAWRKEPMLVLTEAGQTYWTWADEAGCRHYQIFAPIGLG